MWKFIEQEFIFLLPQVSESISAVGSNLIVYLTILVWGPHMYELLGSLGTFLCLVTSIFLSLISLYYSQMKGQNLTGTLPEEFAKLSHLQEM